MKQMLLIGGMLIEPGEVRELHLPLTESANSRPILLPITVIRGTEEGPKVLITAAVHGDELNGTATVQVLLRKIKPTKLSGTLILVPIVNILSFLLRSRYLPDHRDLNRFFPGDPKGNMTERFAYRFFQDVVRLADYCVDLHTAAVGRENFPHIRAKMNDPVVRRLAKGFGPAIVIDHMGRPGTLRRAATEHGIPSILFEGGTANKFERPIVKAGAEGLEQLLVSLGMITRKKKNRKRPFQIIVKNTTWIRAERGGILELKVQPGSLLHRGDVVGTISNPLGRDVHTIHAAVTGLVIGVTTNPVTNPGSPIAHVAQLRKTLTTVERAIAEGRFKVPKI